MTTVETDPFETLARAHADLARQFGDLRSTVLARGAGNYALLTGATFTGPVLLPDGTAVSPALAFAAAPGTGLFRSPGDALVLSTGGVQRYVLYVDTLRPEIDNVVSLGVSGARWEDVWAGNATIQTSDVTVKSDVQPIDPSSAVARVHRLAGTAVTFTWRNGRRRHAGWDAEKVGEAVGSETAAYVDPALEDRPNPHPEHSAAHAEWEAETDLRRQGPKGVRPAEMLPDVFVALAAALERIDALEARVARLAQENAQRPSGRP